MSSKKTITAVLVGTALFAAACSAPTQPQTQAPGTVKPVINTVVAPTNPTSTSTSSTTTPEQGEIASAINSRLSKDPTAAVFRSGGHYASVRLTVGQGNNGRPGAYVVAPRRVDGQHGYTVSAPIGHIDGNQRTMIVDTDDLVPSMDQEQCATWDSESRFANQQGVMLRAAPLPNGAWSALSVMKSVWGGATWTFSVHYWDGAGGEPGLTAYHPLLSKQISSVLKDRKDDGGLSAPWSLCARTVGDQMSFKVWTGDDPEPSWDDEDKVHTTPIPESAMHPGISGIYAGHLAAGDQINFAHIWG